MATITNNLTSVVTIVDITGKTYDIPSLGSVTIANKLLKYSDLDDGISNNWITVTGFDEIPIGVSTDTTLAAVRDGVNALNPIIAAVRDAVQPLNTKAATDTTLAAVRDAVQPLNAKTIDRTTSWQYSGVVAVTTAVTVKAAAAAGVRNYTTGLQFQNTSATASTIVVQDGATTIWQGNATASMASPASIRFNVPLKGTAATALTVTCATTGANVLVNAQGYEGT